MGVLDLLAADETTVLFSFDDPNGAVNPNAVKAKLMADLDVGTIEPSPSIFRTAQGASRIAEPVVDPVEMRFSFTASATTYANLATGLGVLARWLRDPPGPLRFTDGSVTNYYDLLGTTAMPTLFRGQSAAGLVVDRFSSVGPIPVTLLRQPWARKADVSVTGVTVPNDLATGTKVRVFPLTVQGDLPTKGQVRVQIGAVSRTLQTSAAADDIIDCTAHGFQTGDPVVFTALTGGAGLTVGTTYYVVTTSFGANTFRVATSPSGAALGFTTDITAGAVELAGSVHRILIASRARNSNAATYFSDYLSETGYLNCDASGRGWTITLGTETTSVADTEASGGNMARCTHTTNPTVMARRIRATRTTLLDSLRGSWDVWLRCKPNNGGSHSMQLRWGPSTADPAVYNNPVVSHDGTDTSGTVGYFEKNLGPINIPEDVTLGGLALEVWTTSVSASDALDMDTLWLVPRDRQGTVVVPGGSQTVTHGADLLTPVTNPAGGTAGVVSGTYLLLNTTTNNAGIGAATGTVLPAGLHQVTWRFLVSGTSTIRCVVRNITASADVVSVTKTFGNGERSFQTLFVADGTSAYQEQVDDPGAANVFQVQSITRTFYPALARNESARTDPARSTVDRLDTSGNVSGYLGNEGASMATLEPGDNHLMIRCDEVPLLGFAEGQNQLERTPTVSVIYPPRYAL
jgi:hypothetical protein